MRKRFLGILGIVALLLMNIPTAAFAAEDWDVSNGHFFTQTGGGGEKGFAVTDDDGVHFWSEFKRLGGVQAVGYPSSQRFQWDGFAVQVFQRVVFQWRPECKCVYFVNVFDRLHDLGKDDWLLAVRQTPRPKDWHEDGLSWAQIVTRRLAVLGAYPAIRTKYFAVVGDPIQMNGLPTSDVIDMGNHYALRAQRVVFQQWKEDVPWARKGQVTVALGGDIAKETGTLSDRAALQPTLAPDTTPPQTSRCVARVEASVEYVERRSGTQTQHVTALDADGRGVQGATVIARVRDGTGTHTLEFVPTGEGAPRHPRGTSADRSERRRSP